MSYLHIAAKDDLLASLHDNLILLGYRGSLVHGTYEENTTHDDFDVMGVYVPPKECVFGLGKTDTIERMIDEKLSQKKTRVWDIVYYSVQKYMSLLLKQNPNVLSLLWIDPKYYIHKTHWGDLLISQRQNLLSKECYHSFSGYAYGQLHRMTHIGPTGRLGEKRKELISRFGYDVKNASHLLRLLKMGIEVLNVGELLIERPERKMLLAIKRGEWPLQKVIDLADSLQGEMVTAFNASFLKNKVNYGFVNELCMNIVEGFYKEKVA